MILPAKMSEVEAGVHRSDAGCLIGASRLIFDRKAKSIYADDPSTKDILRASSFGNVQKGRLMLQARGGALCDGCQEGATAADRKGKR